MANDSLITTMSATVFLLVSWLAVLSSTAVAVAQSSSSLFSSSSSPFRIIIDGGSTGSRLHVFEFVPKNQDEEIDDDDDDDDDDVLDNADDLFDDDSEQDVPPSLTTSSDCVRRGSTRANIPLSAFGRLSSERHEPLNATHVAQHLLPLFEYAATVIPPRYHDTTSVMYQATAGMRLLDLEEQEAVYDALYDGLMESDTFVFHGMRRSDIATLSGELEGFYGAVAANYLKDIVDSNMRISAGEALIGSSANPSEQSSSAPTGPIGALDMGGSSTQIVFLPGPDTSSSSSNSPQTCVNVQATTGSQQQESDNGGEEQTCQNYDMEMPSHLNGDDFFSTSYLSYGVDQFRERLWSTWIQERRKEEEASPDSCAANNIIPNPCSYKGYKQDYQGYTLLGTGNTDECIREVQRLIPHPEGVEDEASSSLSSLLGRQVGGIEHPPVRGKFFAMSLYFFTLDSLRVLSQPKEDAHEALNLSWPTPSIEELHNALDGLCSRSWQGDLEDIQHNAHSFTRAEVLPHRCVESVYMVTLLRDGFGFHPSSRDITFTFLVDGSEVEWTLGMAIASNAASIGDGDGDNVEESSSVASQPQTTTQDMPENSTTFDDDECENSHRVMTKMITPFAYSFIESQ